MRDKPVILSGSLLLLLSVKAAFVLAGTDFGTLFTDAAQRNKLDQLRAALSKSKKVTLPAKQKQPRKNIPATRYYSVKGVVKRSDGKDQVWINEQSLSTDSAGKSYHLIRNPDGSYSVKLKIPGKVKRVELKPGQTYLLDTDKTIENYDVELPKKSK